MTRPNHDPAALKRRNARIALGLGTVVAGMVGLSFAAVPLYDLFCRVTGYGGTTQVAEQLADRVVERPMTIRFNADVNEELPWHFRPEVVSMTVRPGEPVLTHFVARNDGDRPVVGTATYNVTPDKAGIYFNKVQCFCFTQQLLMPGQEIIMPVTFFVDPAMVDDDNTRDVATITLSYTFFPDPDQSLARTAEVAPAANGAMDGAGATRYQETAERPAVPDTAASTGR